ncbi:TadE-like protein [Botrimarina colliarenosi]|uniref:TadE-like protein n=1 Tax=Botrimarina colliarenosi TaxID=2528001 RepID=A0A5C6A912_9BACT|nr:TadE family protein [Botrimarina colliarenosi]TWT95870.1 TadE-like protein [Botrimarina colliarenosi]
MPISRKRRAARGRLGRRLGVEIVELAFALPVMVVIVFGVLETCELLFLKQSLAVAAYETGRVAARPEATTAAAVNRFQQIATARRVANGTITITPAELSSAVVGDTIRITVAAPVSNNNTTSLVLSSVPDVVETVVVLRE